MSLLGFVTKYHPYKLHIVCLESSFAVMREEYDAGQEVLLSYFYNGQFTRNPRLEQP
jgi:hypothetical protein